MQRKINKGGKIKKSNTKVKWEEESNLDTEEFRQIKRKKEAKKKCRNCYV